MVGVAQLVEPRIVIPVVVGSSPIVHPIQMCSRPLRSGGVMCFGPLAQLVEQETLNLLVVGSTPTRPTNFPAVSGMIPPVQTSARDSVEPDIIRPRKVAWRPRLPGTAKVAKLVDALVLGTSGATLESSSLSFRTIRLSGTH